MSTDLYGIRVLEVAPTERRTRWTVFVVYYDAAYQSHQPLPEDPSFFLRALWDKADTRFGGGGSLGREIAVDQRLDEEFVDANAHRFVERTVQLQARNHPVTDWSGYSDFYYERDGRWKDEAKLVQADYDIFVTDARYLDHLKPGMSWGTTSYETRAIRMTSAAAQAPDLRGKPLEVMPFHGEREDGAVDTIAFSDDSSLLAAASQHGELVVLDTARFCEKLRTKRGELFDPFEFLPDSHVLVRRPARGAPSAWDVDTGRPVAVEAAIGRLASPRGTWRVDFGEDNKLTFASAKTGAVPSAIVTELDCLEAVAFTRDERTVALGGIGKVIQLFSVADGKQLCRIEVPQRVTHLAFAADERFFAATLGAGDRALFRTEDGEQVALIPSRELTHAAAFSRDGRWAAFVHYGPDGYGGGIAIHPLTAEAKAQLAGAGAKPKAEKRRGPKSPAAGGRPKKRAKKPARKPAKATQRRRTR